MTLRKIANYIAAGIASLFRTCVLQIPNALCIGGLYLLWLGIAAQFGQPIAQIALGIILFLLPVLAKLRGSI